MVERTPIPDANTGVAIAYALDTRERVCSALAAPRAETYRCLACGGRLALRRDRDRKAFRHLGRPHCNGSGVARPAAARILQRQVLAELRAQGAVVWQRPCPGIEGVCRDRRVFTQRKEAPGWDEVRIGPSRVPTGPESEGAPLDVAVLAQQRVLIGFVLRERDCSRRSESAEPTFGKAWLATLALEDVLAFRPRVPLGGAGDEPRCRECEEEATRRQTQREGLGWHRGSEPNRVWREVMAAAGKPEEG